MEACSSHWCDELARLGAKYFGLAPKTCFSNNVSQAPLFKQFVLGTAFQIICPSVLCPMLRRRSSSMSRACGSACSFSRRCKYCFPNNLSQAPLSKRLVPSIDFLTICPKHCFPNNVSQAPLLDNLSPSSAFQTICHRHTVRALILNPTRPGQGP